MSRGKRESSWYVIRRCLALIRCVQRGPASREDLLQVVREAESEEENLLVPSSESALQSRLEKDLGRIRDDLLVDLSYNRRLGQYEIKDTWLPLLDLPDEDLETMAWLEETFGLESPKHDDIRALLDRLRLYLGVERQAGIKNARTALKMELRQRDNNEIKPEVKKGLTKAFATRRQAELLYLSPTYEDGEPRRHVVEPYEPYYFDPERGHYYLQAYCRRVEEPDGPAHPNAYLTYRLGRIQKVTVLPNKLSPIVPSRRSYRVEYELTADVARLDVSTPSRIKVAAIERRDDGSVLVRGETESVFWAVQGLLHYGPNCEVLGGPKMRREMERVVGEMAELYEA
jgi:predicted DNA-binding transcriptional regulator YafY